MKFAVENGLKNGKKEHWAQTDTKPMIWVYPKYFYKDYQNINWIKVQLLINIPNEPDRQLYSQAQI